MPTLQTIKANAESAAVAVERLKQLYTDQRKHTWDQGQRNAADEIVERLVALRQYYGTASKETDAAITAISTAAVVDANEAEALGEAPDFEGALTEIKRLEEEVGKLRKASASVPASSTSDPLTLVNPVENAQSALQAAKAAKAEADAKVDATFAAVAVIPKGGEEEGAALEAWAAAKAKAEAADAVVAAASAAAANQGGGYRYSQKKHSRTRPSSHKKTKSGRTSLRRSRVHSQKRSRVHSQKRSRVHSPKRNRVHSQKRSRVHSQKRSRVHSQKRSRVHSQKRRRQRKH